MPDVLLVLLLDSLAFIVLFESFNTSSINLEKYLFLKSTYEVKIDGVFLIFTF